jgi:hypothetical protein
MVDRVTVDAESNLNCTYTGNHVAVDAESNLNCIYTGML